MDSQYDRINPPHYKGDVLEVVDVIEEFLPNDPHIATAVIYLLRAGKKPDSNVVEDLKKATWWIERRIKFLERKARETVRRV